MTRRASDRVARRALPHPVLATPRLRLRPLIGSDAVALYPTLADAELMTYSADGPLASIEASRDYLLEDAADVNWRAWAITRHGDDRAIGWVSAGRMHGQGVTEIGFILARENWGRGFASEAVAVVLDRLFAEGQHRVFADADSENRASILLLERLGFRRERLLRGEWETHIGLRDSVIFGLHADDWLAAGAA